MVASPAAGARAFASPRRRLDRAAAWMGAVLFAGSLAYFLYSYAVTFGETAAGPGAAGAVTANIALFTAFALHHSVFARERVRARVARLVSPTLERSVYVWAASLMLIAVCALWQPVPGVAWQIAGPTRWLLHGGQLLGVWVTLRSAGLIDVWELAGVRQIQSGPEGRPDTTEFKSEGPYGWVRHPIYLGWFLLVFLMPTMTMTRLVFAAVSGAYILVAIPFEERSLRRSSASAYGEYVRKVRWKLVPGVY